MDHEKLVKVEAVPPMTIVQVNIAKEVHRPYTAMAGELCLECSLGGARSVQQVHYPCLIARLIEYYEGRLGDVEPR